MGGIGQIRVSRSLHEKYASSTSRCQRAGDVQAPAGSGRIRGGQRPGGSGEVGARLIEIDVL
jgi:hypothetical protein